MKQRLVGVMVLISLGVIFLPSLFSRESDGRVVVNTQSLIPPKPDVRTIVIAPPQSTVQIPAPNPNDAFQPSTDASGDLDSSASIGSTVSNAKAKEIAKNIPSIATLKLNKKGLPDSWVIQVASFQSQAHAKALNKKLLDKTYKAYVRSVNTAKGEFFRVLVGPYIDRSRAGKAKVNIDKTYRVNSQILRFSKK
ncbi:MAG: DedD protein [Candidatus Endobugula sp.]|jgi:DedD protein